jgi:formamidopyrimidine-DNA glycosylase
VFSDSRRFGRIRLLRDPPHEAPIRHLGFDVLDEMPRLRELARLLAGRRAPIKAALLDQGLFAGVGNWIADEALYQARIRPDRSASGLRREEVARLRARLQAIVRLAVDVAADSGRFPRGWLFPHRWGRDPRARTAAGERIVHVTIAGRTAAFVPARQR